VDVVIDEEFRGLAAVAADGDGSTSGSNTLVELKLT
jgi:hypothetical protein